VRVLVIGEYPDGRAVSRTVTFREYVEAWGPYARLLWTHALRQTFRIDGHRIRIELVP
jgi:hypothetical protein